MVQIVAELPAGVLGSSRAEWSALGDTELAANVAAAGAETADEPRTSAFPWLGLAEMDGEGLGAIEADGAEATGDVDAEAGEDPTATPEPSDEAPRAETVELAAELVEELVEL